MSSTKWMIKTELQSTKPWNSKPSPSPRLESTPAYRQDAVLLQQLTLWREITTPLWISMTMLILLLQFFPDLIFWPSWRTRLMRIMTMLWLLSSSIHTWRTIHKSERLKTIKKTSKSLKSNEPKSLKLAKHTLIKICSQTTAWTNRIQISFHSKCSRNIWFTPRDIWNQSFRRSTRIKSPNSTLTSDVNQAPSVVFLSQLGISSPSSECQRLSPSCTWEITSGQRMSTWQSRCCLRASCNHRSFQFPDNSPRSSKSTSSRDRMPHNYCCTRSKESSRTELTTPE